MNPSISPDQKWVVYLASDGIRISDIDGLNSRKLVSANTMSVVNGQFLIFDSGEPPQPQWSPDSKELIYHKCINQNCSNISDYNIYIYNLETNEETLVIEGGGVPLMELL
jgi:Tol biopolymer transport system component